MSGHRLYIALFLVALTACGQKSVVQSPDPATEQPIERPVEQASLDSKCHGKRVPPTNYMQATAFVPSGPAAAEEATQLAIAKLRDRICQGFRCTELAPLISLWTTDSDAGQVCAMAVIKSEQVAEFKSAPSKKLDSDLSTRAAQLVESVKRKKGEPRIGFDNVTDFGVDGGPRAEWLIDRMSSALSRHGALIVPVPADWAGRGLPKGLDGVLRATLVPMHGREAMLEVTWKVHLAKGLKAVEAIAFPELIGPAIDPLSMLPSLAGINPALGLRFDSRPGGGLCDGQETELRLETGADLHVRVVNLFGDGSRGMVIYASDDVVPAQQTQSLGKFQVVKATEIPVERFVVFGATSKTGLGALAQVKAPCRIPSELATRYSANRGVPDGAKKYTASRSYRILEGEQCSSFQPATMPANWFESIPECF